ncbi:MAG TPA: hypothetical protein VGI93_14730 [Steroidobacteraceae bacterium]
MSAPESAKKRGPFMVLTTVVMLSSAIMIYLFWRYSIKALIVTGALLCFFYLMARLARAIETQSLPELIFGRTGQVRYSGQLVSDEVPDEDVQCLLLIVSSSFFWRRTGPKHAAHARGLRHGRSCALLSGRAGRASRRVADAEPLRSHGQPRHGEH